ncbi:kinetochore-associated protein KNL-2 homolog [Coffea eugenioides]|uniref:kinetochore-associated protein KNL-2 homolog n=1 Tax=Coffea eugenioides TaxID=49369 RepID=UPI000F60C8A7|nr:kinetochore-associated protein KNL-2 homolog [Coffea eugenioides]
MQMTTPSTPNNCTSTSRSYFQTTVGLSDWWLVKAEKDFRGKRLAIAGIPHRDEQALRVFSSAPILKRHDLFNLETADGVWIIIKGLINKARTEENGFPSEVFDHFIIGFPPYWEEYALNCFGGESPTMGTAQSNCDSENLSPEAGIVVPVTVDFTDCPRINHKNASSEEAEDDNCKKNSSIEDSPAGGRNESSSKSKSGGAKPSDAVSQQESRVLAKFRHSDCYCRNESGLSPMVPEASGKELSSSNCSIEQMETLELSGNSLDDNVRQPLAQAGFEENSDPPSDQANMFTDGDRKQDQKNKRIRKRARKVMHSPSWLGGVGKKREKNAGASKRPMPNPANFSVKKGSPITRKKKEESFIALPESLSLQRSRSGRLLLPTMQFWRNQRAVYDADRRIMGIKDPQLNQHTKGSRSEPQRKKRQLR